MWMVQVHIDELSGFLGGTNMLICRRVGTIQGFSAILPRSSLDRLHTVTCKWIFLKAIFVVVLPSFLGVA